MEVTGKFFINNCKSILNKNTLNSGERGFEILGNIEDRATLQKHVKRARYPITMITINTKPDEATKNKEMPDIDQVADILEMGNQSR